MTVSDVKFHATAFSKFERGMTMIERLWQVAVGLSVFLDIPAEPSAAPDAAANLAINVSNPVASLINLPSRHHHDFGLAGENGPQDSVRMQHVVPFSISDNWRVIFRTITPFVSLDALPSGAGGTGGIGSLVESFFFLPKQPTAGGLVWGVGSVFQLPASPDDRLCPKQVGAGVAALDLVQQIGWTYGTQGSDVRSVSCEDRYGESFSTLMQPFVSRLPARGTSVSLNAETTCNRITEGSSVPIMLTEGQIIQTPARPVQLSAVVRYGADSPTSAADGWGSRLFVKYPDPN